MTGQDRYRRVMDTFVDLADTLASDYDVGEFLELLVDRCGEVLRVDTAGVLLETPEGSLQLAAAMTDEMERIEQVELERGQGPCIEAYRTRKQVLAEDLTEHEDRWPVVVPRLLDIGMQAGYAFPLRRRDDCIGALNLYRREQGKFLHEDVRLAQAFADVAAIGILQERKVTKAEKRADHLAHALESRVIIEQAKGVLAQQAHVSVDVAFEALRRHARDNRVRLRDLARAVVKGTTQVPMD